MPSRIDAVVLVSRLDQPTLQALAYAKATRPDTLTALTVATGEAEIQQLEGEWAERDIPIPLTVVDAPYRDITGPILRYVAGLPHAGRTTWSSSTSRVRGWPPWEQLLHNQSAAAQPGLLSSVACWSGACPGSSVRRIDDDEERGEPTEVVRSEGL